MFVESERATASLLLIGCRGIDCLQENPSLVPSPSRHRLHPDHGDGVGTATVRVYLTYRSVKHQCLAQLVFMPGVKEKKQYEAKDEMVFLKRSLQFKS